MESERLVDILGKDCARSLKAKQIKIDWAPYRRYGIVYESLSHHGPLTWGELCREVDDWGINKSGQLVIRLKEKHFSLLEERKNEGER